MKVSLLKCVECDCFLKASTRKGKPTTFTCVNVNCVLFNSTMTEVSYNRMSYLKSAENGLREANTNIIKVIELLKGAMLDKSKDIAPRMIKEQEFIEVIRKLLLFIVSGRRYQTINPYCIEEVTDAMKLLAREYNIPHYLDLDLNDLSNNLKVTGG